MPHERPKKEQTKRADKRLDMTVTFQHDDGPGTKEARNIERR